MRRLLTGVLITALATAYACGADASDPSAHQQARVPAPHGRAPATTFTSWPMYHQNAAHAGVVTRSAASPLHQAWAAHLDGAVYGEPLVVGTTLVVATENDSVYGLDARTGKPTWRRHLGTPAPQSSLPCGDIDPLGITGTPAYDAATGSVFAVAETRGGHHYLYAVSAATGHEKWRRSLDVLPHRNRKAEQERSAVLVTHHRVVVSFGGLAGDCDNYDGYVTSTATTGKGKTFHYAVPTAREAGMWSPAGPVQGRNGDVYVASGNGAEVGGTWDKSDSVTELHPVGLKRVGVFAPSTWSQDNRDDLDLGSSSPAIVAKVHRIVIAGKRGTVYLLGEKLKGIGSALATAQGCKAFGGAAVSGRTVLMPCAGESQVRALRVGPHSLHWGWTASVSGSPVIAGDKVYVADRNSGDLLVLRLKNGSVVQRIHAGDLTHFPSETVDGGYVFVPTLSGVTAFRG